MKKLLAMATLALSTAAVALPVTENFRMPIPGEYIVKTQGQKLNLPIKKRLGKDIVLVKTNNKNSLHGLEYSPNYEYFGNYLDVMNTPNDVDFSKQFHHQMINTKKAWNTTQGDSEIVVAVTDNEFDLTHNDLKQAWFVNVDEIAGNGIDDDNNGYIDDVIGWDFLTNDNNVDSESDPTHGTHVSGIIAATANNQIGGAGIAPNVKVMPLRWCCSDGSWTSAVVAETYRYAVDNGANIINTSYNIDGMVDDQAYLDAVAYARANDVLIFNSAGNGGQKDPPRQKIEEVVLVCSVQSKDAKNADKKSSFSNFGSGIDICAPGDPIYAPVRRAGNASDRHGELKGTSMAAPAAAAVAALIWSANPNFSDEEVRDKLYQTADDIKSRNWPWIRSGLGAGRINAAKAVK